MFSFFQKHGFAGYIRLYRQFPAATIDQYSQGYAGGPAVIKNFIHRRANGAAGM